MNNVSLQKISFPRKKPNLSSTHMHLKLHTATQSENHYFGFDATIIENHWFYTAISLSNGLWKVHFCSMVQNKHLCGSPKKHVKPVIIQQIASKRPQNHIIKILLFLTYSSNIVKWPLRAPEERPQAPRGAAEAPQRDSDSPDKSQNQCQWTQNLQKLRN